MKYIIAVLLLLAKSVDGFTRYPVGTAFRIPRVPIEDGKSASLSPSNQPRARRLSPVQSRLKDEVDSSKDSDLSWFWKCCLPLWLVYISNQWSRSSIYYLVDFSDKADSFAAMNIDIGFDQAQYGLLASLAFTTLFAVASLGAGAAADRVNRKSLTLASAVCWSAVTVGMALADSFNLVLGYRVLMGLACAFSTPTAYTLLRDRVAKDRQATASSIYGTGVAVASGLSSLTLLLDRSVGWRSSLEIVGGFGLVATVLTLLLIEDDNNNEDTTRLPESKGKVDESTNDLTSEIISDVQSVFETDRARWIYLASLLRFSSGLCIGVWAASLFRMEYPDYETQYSLVQAFISAGVASLSGILGGTVADQLASSQEDGDSNGRRLWVPVAGSLLAAPAWFLAVQPDIPFETAMGWLAVEYLVAECWFGPTISTLQSTVGPRVGGIAQGVFTLTGALGNLAPSLVGFSVGQASDSSAELSTVLAYSVSTCYVLSAICFSIASGCRPEGEVANP